MSDRIFNFSAGPAVMPEPVLERARDEMLNFQDSGMSVMEMSHRSPEFEGILARTERGLRQAMGIPDDYAVLFLQGGASLQFSMVPMNLYLPGRPIDVLHTGAWTEKAIEEIKKVAECRLAASTEAEKFRRLPRPDEIEFNPDASYVHICSNNTIFGTQWRSFPDTGGVPLVADMSSDILSRPVDVSKFGLIFAGAQKNIGPAGVTLVVMRKELAERAPASTPTMLKYATHIKNNSLYNTPPTFGIYMIGLVMDWIEAEGGVVAIEERNEAKAKLLYGTIDATGFYTGTVEKQDRSYMNVNFRIQGSNEELEKKFAKEAEAAGLSGLKGHRSVGGLRASIYNAMPLEGVQTLVDFMREFERKNG
ncbi:MAG: 3-phosphoserine/phosphohydroxythreonine transaminase [Anaerolineae bacterium]|nr:3-phosphoserine/phosphohydroxythreonine transaminase [Anaerolineales bacterium]MCQ3976201.1 3-phosphoserine/phosphohydroxythreonine transaminase [Anaerolineae bacterium]